MPSPMQRVPGFVSPPRGQSRHAGLQIRCCLQRTRQQSDRSVLSENGSVWSFDHWQLVRGSLQYGTFCQLKTSRLRVSMVRRSHSAGLLVDPCTVMRVRFGTGSVWWITPVELLETA